MRRIGYANITSTVALLLALSGTAVAAKHYLITSSKQIKPGVIAAANLSPAARTSLAGARGPQGPVGPQGLQGAKGDAATVGTGAVTAAQLADGAVTSSKLAPGAVLDSSLAPGISGAKLTDGSVPRAALSAEARMPKLVIRASDLVDTAHNTYATYTVGCHAGEVATGGGGYRVDLSFSPQQIPVVAVRPETGTFGNNDAVDGDAPTGWATTFYNTTTSDIAVRIYVICAQP